ncbi:MAG: putative PDDEXK endonuclease [Ilumatobacteraceae bacterium]
MGSTSRNKGARGEREVARVLTEITGVEWRRGIAQTRRGGREAPDVEPVDPESRWNDWHLEVKRAKSRVDRFAAMVQACRDAEERDCSPVVVWRVDRQPWRVTVRAGDLVINTMTHGNVGGEWKQSGGLPPNFMVWDGALAELVDLDLAVWCRLVNYWWMP